MKMALKRGAFFHEVWSSIFHVAFKTKVHMFGLSSTSVWGKVLTKSKLIFLNDHIAPGGGMKIKSQITKSGKYHEASNKVNKSQYSASYKK